MQKIDLAKAAQIGRAHFEAGRLAEAKAVYRKILKADPSNAIALHVLGIIASRWGEHAQASMLIGEALRLEPANFYAHINLGNVFKEQGKLDQAQASYRRAIQLNPHSALAHYNLGTALHALGLHAEAVASYDSALAIIPDHAVAHSNKIFTLDFIPGLDFAAHQQVRQQWHAHHASRLLKNEGYRNAREASRRLTLGYVSADFKAHSASATFYSILKHHERERFKVICYSGVELEDRRSRDFRKIADLWRPVAKFSDDALAEQIRKDEVDILIDLSGHTAGNRLLVFARKPAPIQVTAWGHATGTGLRAIDYLFSDAIAIPLEARPLFAEKIVDLPCIASFDAPKDAPPIAELPSLTQGFMTFGCLNRFTKVSASSLALWGQILRQVPNSRLLLKDDDLGDAGVQDTVRSFMAGHGLASDRLVFQGNTSRNMHLATYNQIDIALDPFPHSGGISTWEALWMGVPVVSLPGNSIPSRLAASILGAIGHSEWVAADESDYVSLAISLSANPEALASFRRESRDEILRSPAGSPALYTQAVESAYRTMWETYLRDTGNESK